MASGGLRHGQSAFWGDAVGPNPTDRGKVGSKRNILVGSILVGSILVEGLGGPLSVVLARANVHDTKLLAETLERIVVVRPADYGGDAPNLCLDNGYDNPTGPRAVANDGYVPHIRRIGEEKLTSDGRKRYPARRWMVERTLGWLSKCRGILVRYDKKASNYLGLLQLACALLWYRRQWQLLF